MIREYLKKRRAFRDKPRILHDWECIYVHVPKTAGSSITTALNELPPGPAGNKKRQKMFKHVTASELRRKLGASVWDRYFTFAVVRNPWDLMVSSYNWWLQWAPNWTKFRNSVADIEAMGSFERFMLSDYGRKKINQMEGDIFDWIAENDEIIVKYVARFENLQDDWKTICDHLKASPPPLPHENRTNRRSYRAHYSDETRQIVADRFQRAIDAFGYEF